MNAVGRSHGRFDQAETIGQRPQRRQFAAWDLVVKAHAQRTRRADWKRAQRPRPGAQAAQRPELHAALRRGSRNERYPGALLHMNITCGTHSERQNRVVARHSQRVRRGAARAHIPALHRAKMARDKQLKIVFDNNARHTAALLHQRSIRACGVVARSGAQVKRAHVAIARTIVNNIAIGTELSTENIAIVT